MGTVLEKPEGRSAASILLQFFVFCFQSAVTLYGCWKAYAIRTYAIEEYGPIIHEFDPWFNYRATEYLHEHGRAKFFTWFDHMSWYPLGRPVGTTIYPGMQFTAVGLYHLLNWLGIEMSLNDVCCYVPAWFGASASLLTGFMTFECTNSWSAMAAATLVMAIMPAHLLRSIGGGYDNESIAVTAMCLTFWLWCRCLRDDSSWPISVAAGIAYSYMVAAWGGYVFVINMVAAHAGLLLAMGRYDQKLYKCYSIFYAVGTLLAMQIPVVGWTPLKSLEQVVPLILFLSFQLLQLFELSLLRTKKWSWLQKNLARLALMIAALAFAAVVIRALIPMDVLTPVSLRVSSLFIKHTRTGNPLVDSVAEHQATSPDAYWQFLYYGCYLAPAGALLTLLFGRKSDAKSFILLFAVIALYFANKMSRLVILLGPVVSALSGIAMGMVFDWIVNSLLASLGALVPGGPKKEEEEEVVKEESSSEGSSSKEAKSSSYKKGSKKTAPAYATASQKEPALLQKLNSQLTAIGNTMIYKFVCAAVAIYMLTQVKAPAVEMWGWSQNFAHDMSQPSIVFKAQLQNGKIITVTDYLDSYKFLRSRTPKDARILAWWDYGYQITGIGRRTSLADGNTWNQAHIALIGKMLTSTERKAHRMIRHMADYVLVWAGGDGDDLGKSPHLARIASSNFPKHCGSDRNCEHFGFYGDVSMPTKMMAESLLYKMTSNEVIPGVTLNKSLWEEVYQSKYGKVRIYKVKDVDMESRAWLADPANKLCDAPGSWYCPGQYPPALWKYLPAHFLTGHRLNATDSVTSS